MAEVYGDKQQLINKIERFFSKSVGKNITKYVLGSSKVSRCVKVIRDYPAYFNNIFSLAFIFAYGCLRYDNDCVYPPKNESFTNQNSVRIVNSLKKAYGQYPVNSDLIQFVLSDIQFEMLQSDDRKAYEVFGQICNFRDLPCSLSKYYKVISEWKVAPSRFFMDENELLSMFYNLIKNMTFLKKYDLVTDDGGLFMFVDKEAAEYEDFDEPYSIVSVKHLIHHNDNYMNLFSLYSVEKQETSEGRFLSVTYVTGGGFNSISFVIGENKPEGIEDEFYIEASADDYYYEIFGTDWDYISEQERKKNSNFIDQVHAINYKYIKNLALSISDTISTNKGSKAALYSRYHRRYKDIFREIEEKLTDDLTIELIKFDWDAIIVMLLIESSPTSVLETLFKSNPQTFVEVAKNLNKRIDSPELPFYGKDSNDLDLMVNDIIKTKLVVGETRGFGIVTKSQSNKVLRARAEALLIVSSLSSIHEQQTVEKTICAGNIYDNIALLNEIKNDPSAEKRIEYTCTVLGETFRHLICFYKGILAYGEKKLSFDAEYSNRFLSDSQISSYQKEMQKAFLEAAKQESEEIKVYSSDECDGIRALIKRFISLCEDCSSSAKNAGVYSSNIFAVLGKYEIINLPEFSAYANLFIAKYDEINSDNIDQWLDFALDILKYLRKGSFKNSDETLFKAVYPFAATYNKGNENYDGCRTVTFTLNFDVDSDDKVDGNDYINVLTEFSYKDTNVFYCLPNVLRSNKRWWIDPLLIGFKEFNDIFEE